MDSEDDLLRALLDDPADDTTRMVYADWLDEQGDPESSAKAHFLRVTVRLMGPIPRVGWRSARKKELHALATTLPPAWLAVVSRVRVERCGAPAAPPEEVERLGVRFNFICDQRWDEMRTTPDARVRHCPRCHKDVHYCDTADAARMRAKGGHCIALSLAAAREPGDLEVSPGIKVGGAGLI